VREGAVEGALFEGDFRAGEGVAHCPRRMKNVFNSAVPERADASKDAGAVQRD
jgi:hypothetical protein